MAAEAGGLRLPALFGDHMVLQSGVKAPIWGWAEPGTKVTVSIGRQSKSAVAGQDGRWMLRLDPLGAGEAYTLTVQGSSTLTVQDVLAGEVWLASGQSNMAMPVSRAQEFEKESAAADLPKIRMFTVERTPAREPQAECRGKWEVCAPASVGAFSATAYFFGREVHRALGVPVGLINSSVGGTPIQAWPSRDAGGSRPGRGCVRSGASAPAL